MGLGGDRQAPSATKSTTLADKREARDGEGRGALGLGATVVRVATSASVAARDKSAERPQEWFSG